ncbi:hypothetical protein [Albimonas pacifica]|uniref:Uncharacterized protein n=1 Tax=Albimonas pacifica TaxID=1114924 RepID=A0A1I3IFQ5_9RHOB|nr:hypothetical protein [Albimonas pacifica]SFI46761.1 hypothetical protein SAMN05216258_10727 [Albimonas pacifica]
MLAARPQLRARPTRLLPVEPLLLGRAPEEAARVLADVIALCGGAQACAARAAFGLPARPEDEATRRAEIRRDHLARLLVLWPARLGLPPCPLPADRLEGGPLTRQALFGGPPPATEAEMLDFLASPRGVAPVFAALAARFAAGEAAVHLPLVCPSSAFQREARVENSVAARRAADPALQAVEFRHGRGPLWRAAARLVDLAAELDLPAGRPAPPPEGRPDPGPGGVGGREPGPGSGRLPHVRPHGGSALVEAARGLYAVRARVEDGRVAAFERVTPTDHLTAPGGVLERSLATLGPDAETRAELLLAILDPCAPVALEPTGPEAA